MKINKLLVVMFFLLFIYGCGESSSKNENYVLKIGNTVSDIDPFNVALNKFKENIEEQTDGKIKVSLFTNGSIAGTDADVLDKVRANTLQMGHTTANTFAALSGMNEYYVYGIPYLMSTNDELNQVAESKWIEDLNDEFKDKTGVRIFDGGGVNMGWFAFGASDKEINQLSDLSGMSIRINQTNQMIALTKGVNINPQFIAFSEVYTALAQGTVDGMVTNAPLFYSNGFYDQLKSIWTTHSGQSYHFYIINEGFYSSLPQDLQKILDESVISLIEETRALEDKYMVDAIAEIKKQGVVVTNASDEDENKLKRISVESIWWDENVSLTNKDNVNKVLEILNRNDEMK